jgi:hypothetical protein
MSRDAVRKLFNAAIVFGCLSFLGLGFVKSMFVFAVVLACHFLDYGSRWIMRFGFALLVVTVLVIVGFPQPQEWLDLSRSAIQAILGTVRSL